MHVEEMFGYLIDRSGAIQRLSGLWKYRRFAYSSSMNF